MNNMTVKELKDILGAFPEDTLITNGGMIFSNDDGTLIRDMETRYDEPIVHVMEAPKNRDITILDGSQIRKIKEGERFLYIG